MSKQSIEDRELILRQKYADLKSELAEVKDLLDELSNEKIEDNFRNLSAQYGITLFVGQEYVVSSAMSDYAKSRGWDTGFYKSWLVGQPAEIRGSGAENRLTTICVIARNVKMGLSLGEPYYGDWESLTAPFPIELIVEAIKEIDDA